MRNYVSPTAAVTTETVVICCKFPNEAANTMRVIAVLSPPYVGAVIDITVMELQKKCPTREFFTLTVKQHYKARKLRAGYAS